MEWFPPRHLDLEDLAPMGVTEKPLDVDPYAFLDQETDLVLVDVGDVTVYEHDRVIVWPRIGIGARARAALYTTAEDALRGNAHDWEERTTTKGRPYRVTPVYLADNGQSLLALALRAALAEVDGLGWDPRDALHAAADQ